MRMAAVRRFALSLPGAAEAPHFDYASFRVRGKIFATAPPDGLHVHIFVGDDDREQALEIHSDFAEKLFWGAKAVGVRIELARAKPEVVKALLGQAWRRKAPKALLTA